jgi:hypothetical protein
MTESISFCFRFRIPLTDSVLKLCKKGMLTSTNRPGSDAALPNLKKSRRVSIAGGDRKKGVFDLFTLVILFQLRKCSRILHFKTCCVFSSHFK